MCGENPRKIEFSVPDYDLAFALRQRPAPVFIHFNTFNAALNRNGNLRNKSTSISNNRRVEKMKFRFAFFFLCPLEDSSSCKCFLFSCRAAKDAFIGLETIEPNFIRLLPKKPYKFMITNVWHSLCHGKWKFRGSWRMGFESPEIFTNF